MAVNCGSAASIPAELAYSANAENRSATCMSHDATVETSEKDGTAKLGPVLEERQPETADPATENYEALNRAYRMFNEHLFGGQLNICLMTLRARGDVMGYFFPLRFVHENGARSHEIALNPKGIGGQAIEYGLSVLAHQMVHQAQFEDGTAGRRGYHNRDFARRMLEIGLRVRAPGGQSVGERVDHEIVPDGAFMVVVRKLIDANFRAGWVARYVPEVSDHWGVGSEHVPAGVPWSPPKNAPDHGARSGSGADGSQRADTDHVFSSAPQLAGKDRSKVKFACARCQQAAWGRVGLNLICGCCSEPMLVVT